MGGRDPSTVIASDSLSIYREHVSSEEGDEDTPINMASAVDWEEVREGRAAGLPGQWMPVSVESEPNDLSQLIGNDLYDALRLKAAVYANEQWQSYWSTYGPNYLAQTWRKQYPHIPLEDVDAACGLGFLCQSLEDKMQLNVLEQPTTTSDIAAGNNTSDQISTQCPSTDLDLPNNQLKDTARQSTQDNQPKDTSNADSPQDTNTDNDKISKEDLVSLWNTFYNSIYWYTYSLFTTPEVAESAMPKEQDDKVGVVKECTEENMSIGEVGDKEDNMDIDDVGSLSDNSEARELVVEEDSNDSEDEAHNELLEDTAAVTNEPVNCKVKKKKKKTMSRGCKNFEVL